MLGKVGSVGRQQRVDHPLEPIRAYHLLAILAGLHHRLEDLSQTIMKELISSEGVSVMRTTGEVGDRQVAKEDGGVLRRLASHGFVNVANGEINGIGGLVTTKDGERGLV